MNLILRKKAQEIIELVFTHEEKSVIESYKKFTISFVKKDLKINEKYLNRKIEIYNLWRTESELVNSIILGLAHHIDFCERGFTDNKSDFFEIYKKLLYAALDHSYLIFNDLTSSDDYKNIKRIRDALSHYWKKDDSLSGNVKLEVYNAYTIKNYLKDHGFSYNALNHAWEIAGDFKAVSIQKNEILRLYHHVQCSIVPQNKITIVLYAYIIISGNTNHYK